MTRDETLRLMRERFDGLIAVEYSAKGREEKNMATMTLENIPKKVAVRPRSVSRDMLQLAEEAHKALGYSRLKVELTKPLLDALAKLEITIWEDRGVKEYQDNMRRAKGLLSYQWESLRLSKYTKPIPEHVLLKAIEIKKEVPEVHFYVEELHHYPDPFLVARLGEERYYVEVWDEPKFEGRLTKS